MYNKYFIYFYRPKSIPSRLVINRISSAQSQSNCFLDLFPNAIHCHTILKAFLISLWAIGLHEGIFGRRVTSNLHWTALYKICILDCDFGTPWEVVFGAFFNSFSWQWSLRLCLKRHFPKENQSSRSELHSGVISDIDWC